jgi:hypothetical protein
VVRQELRFRPITANRRQLQEIKMVVFGFLFLALIAASILYFTDSSSRPSRKYGLALIVGLGFGSLAILPAGAETIEVVTSANGCTTTYSEAFTVDGAQVSTVTLTCPRLPIQVAAKDLS